MPVYIMTFYSSCSPSFSAVGFPCFLSIFLFLSPSRTPPPPSLSLPLFYTLSLLLFNGLQIPASSSLFLAFFRLPLPCVQSFSALTLLSLLLLALFLPSSHTLYFLSLSFSLHTCPTYSSFSLYPPLSLSLSLS